MDNILKYIEKQKKRQSYNKIQNDLLRTIFNIKDELETINEISTLCNKYFEEAKENKDYTSLKALEWYMMWDNTHDIYFALLNMFQELTPIENLLYACLKKKVDMKKNKIYINPQAVIEKYRVDFMVGYDIDDINNALVIECDGFEYHSTKKQMAADNKRERRIREIGYDVIRFSGTEIYNDVEMCVNEIFKRLDSKNGEKIC